MVVVPIVSYLLGGWMIGWASAPFDPSWQRRYPRRSAWMALAGPAANFTLMLVAGIAIPRRHSDGLSSAAADHHYTSVTASAHSADPTFAATALSILFVLNLLLAHLTFFPCPRSTVMQGSCCSWARTRHTTIWIGSTNRLCHAGLIVAWYAFDRIFGVIFTVALRLLYPGIRYG